MNLDAKIPSGPLEQKWEKHRFELKLVNPANKRKFRIIVVGSGLLVWHNLSPATAPQMAPPPAQSVTGATLAWPL